jgi:tryptophanyl-tRNA synthetase
VLEEPGLGYPANLPQCKVFSGIQPTGIPHLGNYLGALRPWKDIQDAAAAIPGHNPKSLIFCIVDMHALTGGNHNAELFAKNLLDSCTSLLALGLDSDHSTLFVQSHIGHHASLMWILSTVASTGYLSRMTQWKSKLSLPDDASVTDSAAIEKLKLGLFSYPVLQAADILLYRPEIVPVGEDQAQHVEFARDLARRFNHAYCPADQPLFTPPTPQISPAKRIMSLKNPTQKMSKSDQDPASRIMINDSEEDIRAKIKGAVTDSENGITYDHIRRPGEANLIDIFRHTTRDRRTAEEVAAELANMTKSGLKAMVADAVVKELAPIAHEFNSLAGSEEGINRVRGTFTIGRNRAKLIAQKTMMGVGTVTGTMNYSHIGDPGFWRVVDEKGQTIVKYGSNPNARMMVRNGKAERRSFAVSYRKTT